MEAAIIYFGAEPSKNQTVSDELLARNIKLLRLAPSAVTINGGRTTVQPNFDIYSSNLACFMDAAANKSWVSMSLSRFRILDHKGLSTTPFPFPHLTVSWNVAIGEEVKEDMEKQGFVHGLARGKPVMIKRDAKIDDVKFALERKTLQTSPVTEGHMNIQDYKKAMLIERILASFLRTNQYPAFSDPSHESEFNKKFEDSGFTQAVATRGDDEDTDDEMTGAPHSGPRTFKVNLPVDFKDATIMIDHLHVPSSYGNLFKYVPELAQFDRYTVPNVIEKYFYHCLGADEDDAAEMFREILQAWSKLHLSEWGNIMSHIFRCIDITMRCQCSMVLVGSLRSYDGVYMIGAGYDVTILNKRYTPQNPDDLAKYFPSFGAHSGALHDCLQMLNLPEDAKIARITTTQTMSSLKELVDSVGVNGGNSALAVFMRRASCLNFPKERFLDHTAFNIAEVLSYISDTTKDIHRLPLHYTALTETNRAKIAWSAFGDHAPSFRVPGGKLMPLDRSFAVSNSKLRKEAGPGAKKEIGKIGAIVLPLSIAQDHLLLTIKEKNVLNPHGNVVVNAAASHMNKVYEKDSFTMIIAGLRRVSGASVEDVATGSGKRRMEEEDSFARKKGRVDDL